ncbi:MAG TPA: type I polyketide synthase, partial [Thermoanaerobaculia bacterium]|nr:type I polyketide synthase [Thermoanaerobaculia bacterium]
MSGAPAAAAPAGHEIAVIGLAGRFPGAASLEELWQNLAAGRESVRHFSDEELAAAGVPAEVRRLPNFVNARAILDGADLFDAALFGYGPKEAELIDPQHRVLLECAWEALEHAGYDPGRYRGLIGVYAGADANGGAMINQLTAEDPLQGLIANDRDYLATRVCFKLDLRGPGLTIQTACSTSLVAVQVACQGLLGYQCDMALAGGVCIHFPQRSGYLYQEGGILSADGHCRPFDARAGGTVGGDGAGIVVLKRLADALADGDTIHAVIRGAAINNDGATKAGFTAPGIDGQAEVVALALAMADVDPATVTYVETHGTATQIGDPAEIAALTDVFRAHTGNQGFCAIGSLKGNLGHMSAAAGIGGLIKTVLMLERRTLLPSLHFERPNPMIDFAASPFYVNTELRAWPASGQPRRAGVSSFGVGGTNAHVVVEEAPAAAPGGPSRPYQALVVSARTAGALERAAADLAAFLRGHPETPLADVAYTLQRGRALLRHKRLVVAADAAEAAVALAERGTTLAGEARQPAVVFMFPGQGAQQAVMARGIYRTEPEFRSLFDRCAARLEPLLDLDLRRALFADAPAGAAPAALAPLAGLASMAISQPALFAVEYCLARLWMSWGVEPAAMIGHSLGELVAACLAGVMELDEALALVAARGRLIESLPPGAMLAVAAAESDLPPLGPRLALAAVNAPAAVVLSGPPEAIAEIETVLREREIATTRLPITRAFHSAELEPILEPFAAELRRVALHPPRIPYLSGLTGTWIRAAEATDPAYWVQQLRRTVRFSAGVRELASDPDRLLLEVGPGRSLGSLVRKHDAGLAERVLASLPGRRDDDPDTRTLAAAVGQLYCRHAPVDW